MTKEQITCEGRNYARDLTFYNPHTAFMAGWILAARFILLRLHKLPSALLRHEIEEYIHNPPLP